jgi:phage-related protein
LAVVGEAYVIVRAITNRVRPEIERSFSGLGGVGERAGDDVGQGFRRGLNRSGDPFRDLTSRAEASRIKLRQLTNIAFFLQPALAGLAGAVGALGGGLIILGAAAGSAARSLVALGGVFAALIQGAITLKLAFSGVGEAYAAGARGSAGAANSARNEAAALRRLAEARENLKRLIEEEAPRELEKARRRAADAADSAADAVLSAERAERRYAESQKEVLDATEALNKARETARERIQQLRFAVEGAAISEKRARLEFEKARETLQRVQDLPPNSRARQEAELAFAQAELNLRKAIDSNSDLKKEEEQATRAGVEGSDEVVRAKERLAKATQSEVDAAIDASRAWRDAAKAQRDAAEAAADAAAGGRVERELNRRIAAARQAVKDAEEALKDAAGGVDAFGQAMQKLSPEAQRFVNYLLSIQKEIEKLRAAAGRKLFPQLEIAIQNFVEKLFPRLIPLLEGTGDAIGAVAVQFSEALTSGENLDTLERVWKNNDGLIRNLGAAATNLAQIILILLDAAEPVITAFGEWAKANTEARLSILQTTKGFNEARDNFERGASTFSQFVRIFKNIGEAFGFIGEAINAPGGPKDTVLGFLETSSAAWRDGLEKQLKSGSLQEKFQGLANNFNSIIGAITAIGGALLDVGSQPGIGQLFESIKKAVGPFRDIGVELAKEDGPVAKLGLFIEKVAELTKVLTESGAIESFFDTLNFLLDGVISALGSDLAQAILENIGPILATVAAFGIFYRSIRFIAEALTGWILLFRQIWSGASIVFSSLANGSIPIATGLRVIFYILRALLGPIGLIIAALVLAWQNSENFRNAVMAFFGAIWDVIKGIWEGLEPVFGELGSGFEGIGEVIGDVFSLLGDWWSILLGIITPIVGAIFGLIGGTITALVNVISAAVNIVSGIFNFIKGLVLSLVALFTGEWDAAFAAFGKAGEGFLNAFRAIGRAAGAVINGVINGFIDAWNGFADRFKFKLPQWLGGGEVSLPRINWRANFLQLAKGGIVPSTPGGMLAVIGEAGRKERVEPLDPDGLSRRDKAMIDMLSGGGRGTTINVYPSPGMDERELADMVSRRLAYEMRRGVM